MAMAAPTLMMTLIAPNCDGTAGPGGCLRRRWRVPARNEGLSRSGSFANEDDERGQQRGPSSTRQPTARRCTQVALDTLMVGNFDEKSFALAAIFTATLRATALYRPATSLSGSATTVGRPLSACSRMAIVSGSAPR